MPSNETIQLLVQGGAVGIALALIGLLWYHVKLLRTISKEHKDALERNTDAWVKNAEATAALQSSLPNVCHYRPAERTR